MHIYILRYIYAMRILFFCLLLSTHLQAQTRGDAWGVQYMGGRILIHTPKIHVEAPSCSWATEFSYQHQTSGKKDWHQRFGFPEASINLCYANYGDAQLGSSIAVYPAIQCKIIGNTHRYWYGKMGGGIGYANRRWQRLPAADSMNNIIGSHLNNFSMFQSGIHFTIAPRWSAQAGVQFYHLSNAASRSPNYGINTFGAHIGLQYHPNGIIDHFEKRDIPRRKNPFLLNAGSSLGFAESKTVDGPLYRIATLSLSAVKRYRNKNNIMLGCDAIYSSKTRAYIFSTNQTNRRGESLSPWQYTTYVGHEFLFGHTGFPIYAGAYLNRPVGGSKIYQRLGINYYFVQKEKGWCRAMYAQLLLKTHLIQAQYAELGLGFML